MKVFVSHSAAIFGKNAIITFYQNWHLHDALYCFDRLITAACTDKLLLNTVPANHLFFVSELKKLAEGASLALMDELGNRCLKEFHQLAEDKNHSTHKNIKVKSTDILSMIDDSEQIKQSATPAGFDEPHTWMNPPLGGTQWQCFPRHLTAAQFQDPWLAVEAFVNSFSAAGHEEHLNTLLEAALGAASIDGSISAYELITLQRAWWQLLEGCHLLSSWLRWAP